MSTREQRIEVFEDTMRWIESEKDLSAAVAYSKDNTEVFFEDDYPILEDEILYDTEIVVTGDRSFQAAMKLKKENPDAKVAVMNFANAFHPGGGVVRGAGAQEECLCRTSTLYPVLSSKKQISTYYRHHKELRNYRASDSLIYTEGIVICKTDEDLPKRMSKEEWVKVDVITIAAPDLRETSNIFAAIAGNGFYMNDAELFGYHVKRAIHLLTCAAAKGADTLVLGAFGCGAFRNKPSVVAKAYKVAIEEFPKVFKKIEFAVYCSPEHDENYVEFKKVFG